jgi:hypothetical protein
MKLTFTKSVPEVPVGKYTAKFLGITLKEASGKLDEKGRPMPPAMTWDFQISEGECEGRTIDRLTGRTPTAKNGCGKMLAGITDTVLRDGDQIDLEQFIGKTYRITVEENGERTRLSDTPAPVRVWDGNGATASAAPGAGKAPPPKGPPPKPKGEPQDGSAWMLHDAATGEYVAKTAKEIREKVQAEQLNPADLWVYPNDGNDHSPVTAAEAGFKEPIPF